MPKPMSSPVDHGSVSKSGTSPTVLLSSDPPPSLDASAGAAVDSPSSTAELVASSPAGAVVDASPLVELGMPEVSPSRAGASPPQAASTNATIVRRAIVDHAITQALRMGA